MNPKEGENYLVLYNRTNSLTKINFFTNQMTLVNNNNDLHHLNNRANHCVKQKKPIMFYNICDD